tara:strand:+ start:206 stop:667 length:462 start_codon:yes stop_codon:yes gene_type:complete
MKNLITLIIGLLVVGCGEVENGAYKHRPKQTDTNESTPTTNTNKVNGTTEKPAKELTAEEKKVIGTYEMKGEGFTIRAVFLDNGIIESYKNGKKEEEEDKWKIVDGELHIIHEGGIAVFRINKDGNITGIADIEDGKREDFPKENQHTIQKIK